MPCGFRPGFPETAATRQNRSKTEEHKTEGGDIMRLRKMWLVVCENMT